MCETACKRHVTTAWCQFGLQGATVQYIASIVSPVGSSMEMGDAAPAICSARRALFQRTKTACVLHLVVGRLDCWDKLPPRTRLLALTTASALPLPDCLCLCVCVVS